MNMNENTIAVLKNFSTINPSLSFKQGNVLRTMAPNKAVLAKATLDETIPADFAIYELHRFLGVVSLMKNPRYEIGASSMTINGDDRRKVKYVYADTSTFVTPPDHDLNMPNVDVTFELKSNQYQDIMKALGVMSLPELVITVEDGNLILRGTDTSNPSSNDYDIVVGETNSKPFTAIIRTDNLKIVPNDYTVSISSAGICRFESPAITYWVSVESKSTFG